MDARELRLGNLVMVNNEDYHKGLLGVTMMVIGVKHNISKYFPNSRHDVSLMNYEKIDIQDYCQMEEFITPIPIRDEWLKHIGFEISNDSYSSTKDNPATYKEAFYGENPITKDYLLILKNVGDGWFYRNGYFKIDYVHQIQNLHFALTNKELKIIQK